MPQFLKLSELLQKNLQAQNGIFIYLLRHGQSMANHTGSVVGWTDSKLSVKGRLQANTLYKGLYRHVQSFTQIHSSDMSRCVDTLNLSLGFPNKQFKITRQLRQLNFGDHEGLHYDSLPKQEKLIINSFKYKAPNGQNWSQARQRVLNYISQLKKGHHLIASHGGLMCALSYNLGIKQVLGNCSIIAAQICPTKKDLKEIKFVWQFPSIVKQ